MKNDNKLRKVFTTKLLATIAAASFIVLTACSKQEPTVTSPQNTEQAVKQSLAAKVTTLVPGSPFHGIHGLTTDADGNILVGSVIGMNIHKVNPSTGEVTMYQAAPEGQADDLEFSDDGTLVWTAFAMGKIYSRDSDDNIRILAQGLPGINSIAFKQDGRLFATQVFLADVLYEIDITGVNPARKIIEGMGGLNGFDFGPDGKLYGPLWFKGQVARIDVDTGELTVIAEGFTVPAAVNFDSKGVLHVIDNETGEIFKVDITSGEKTLIATAPTNLDNLTFDANDNLYITNMSDNAIYHVDQESGVVREIVGGPLTTPAGIDIYENTLYVADTFSLSKVNINSGEVSDVSRIISDHEYPVAVSTTSSTIVNASSNAGLVQGHDRLSSKRLFRWSGFVAPGGILAREDGTVIVAETGTGKVLMVTGQDDRTVLAENLKEPIGLAEDSEQNIFVAETVGGSISVIDKKTGEVTTWIDGLNAPEGIEFDNDGLLIVAEVGARRVISIDADKNIKVIAVDLPIGLPGYPALPDSFLPTGISVGADNKIYLASDIDNTILVIER